MIVDRLGSRFCFTIKLGIWKTWLKMVPKNLSQERMDVRKESCPDFFDWLMILTFWNMSLLVMSLGWSNKTPRIKGQGILRLLQVIIRKPQGKLLHHDHHGAVPYHSLIEPIKHCLSINLLSFWTKTSCLHLLSLTWIFQYFSSSRARKLTSRVS